MSAKQYFIKWTYSVQEDCEFLSFLEHQFILLSFDFLPRIGVGQKLRFRFQGRQRSPHIPKCLG